jgi:2-(1,2-epoxy-1,2-dihydrophenyl)acetyl-CoA isomerase
LSDFETSDFETLGLEVGDGVAVMTLNRPERMNTMSVTMRKELQECFRRVRADDDARALIVTGAGDAFCAGGDVNDFAERDHEEMYVLIRELSHRWFSELWQMPKPTIAAVNGVAAGGGVNLVLACDLVVASDRARFGETFVKVGLMPDLGGAFLLPRSIGLHAAKALCLSGEVIDAERAYALGFVQQIVPPAELMAEARAIAARLAAGPAHAYAAMKAALNRSFERSMEETLSFELYAQSFLFATRDHGERRDAFLGRET